jgi:hypothetical protein
MVVAAVKAKHSATTLTPGNGDWNEPGPPPRLAFVDNIPCHLRWLFKDDTWLTAYNLVTFERKS